MTRLWVISFLNELELIYLHTSIAIISTQVNGFNYCYLTLLILFNINHLFADSEEVTSMQFNTNYSIQYYSFICIESNDSKCCHI